MSPRGWLDPSASIGSEQGEIFVSLRAVCGDDPVYIAQQIGHTDVTFTLKTYARAVKRRERLTGNHRKAFDEALEWAAMGTTYAEEVLDVRVESTA